MNPPLRPSPSDPARQAAPGLRGLPCVVVHGLGDVRLALSYGRGATLLSAHGAGLFAGVGWWRALVAAGRDACPGAVFDEVLDCADAPGRALEALRHGQRAVVLDPACPAFPALRALALHEGAVLLDRRPAALDLARPGAARRLGAWIGVEPPLPAPGGPA